MAKQVTIQCRCCNGSGRVQLTGEYRKTLELLRKQKQEIHGAALAKLAGCQATAMNNRLAYLERRGLAKSRKYGRKVFYTALKEYQMKTAIITHDVNGIRMNMDGVIHHWANQAGLAESHAHVLLRCERQEAKLEDIADVLSTNLDADEACKRIEKLLREE